MSIAEHRTEEQGKAERYLRRAGYRTGGRVSDKEQDAKMVAEGVHQHERHLHRGEKPTALHLKSGGKVSGKETKGRLDKYARGGRTKSGPSKINIVIATGKDQQQPQAVPVPVPRPVPVPAGPAPAAPAAAPMPTGAMPPGMPPRPPMKRGGAVRGQFALTDAGSAGAAGRIEKTEAYSGKDIDGNALVKVKAHTRRKSGGRV